MGFILVFNIRFADKSLFPVFEGVLRFKCLLSILRKGVFIQIQQRRDKNKERDTASVSLLLILSKQVLAKTYMC